MATKNHINFSKKIISKPLGLNVFSQNSIPQIGIYGINFNTKKSVSYHTDQKFGTASVIKIIIALTLFNQVETGKLNIDLPFKIADYPDIFRVGEYANGALAFLPKHATITLRMACFFMLHLSDNPATNFVLKFVSQKEVNSHIRKLGYKKTKLTVSQIDPVKLEKEKNYLGVTTAWGMADIFGKITRGNFTKDKKYTEDLQKMLEADYPGKTYNRNLPVTWNVPDQDIKIKKIYVKNGSFPAFELRTESLRMITDKN